jgi:DNA-binding response OmpR family regulator
MMKILIVDDYPKINQLLATYIRKEGHEVKQVYDGEAALDAIGHDRFDVILLDLMLPGIQGEALIQHIRSFSDVYIIVLSAKIDVKNRIDAITIGADDYMTKPFSIEEVMAKLRNIDKRLVISHPVVYTYNQGHLKVVPTTREVYVSGHKAQLTHYEYEVLFHLLSSPNNVYSRDMIIEQCFMNSNAYDRVIDAFIKNIRRKIDQTPSDSYIKTHYGVGYQFVGVKDE